MTGQAATVAYITVAILTATTYTFGGLMREQSLHLQCAPGRASRRPCSTRIRSLSPTMTGAASRARAASRRRQPRAAPLATALDCNACVAVCPMGIDIRDGQQLECITCALCIDACDTIFCLVMDKTGKERGG